MEDEIFGLGRSPLDARKENLRRLEQWIMVKALIQVIEELKNGK